MGWLLLMQCLWLQLPRWLKRRLAVLAAVVWICSFALPSWRMG